MRREGSQMGEENSGGGKRVGSTENEGRNVTVMTVAPIRVLCKAEAVVHCVAVFRGMLRDVSRSSVEWRLELGARRQ